jgi:hypothetical protein
MFNQIFMTVTGMVIAIVAACSPGREVHPLQPGIKSPEATCTSQHNLGLIFT